MTFISETNPRKALELAWSVLHGDKQSRVLGKIGIALVFRKSWRNMTNDELKRAIRGIIQISSDEDEVHQLLRDVLDYPYRLCMSSELPTDETGREARELVRGLGGLVMQNGAMVMAMGYGADGEIISL